jgi:hypothetical protein
MKNILLILLFIVLTKLSYGQSEYEPQLRKLSKADSVVLAETFLEFVKAIELKDERKIIALSLDSINCNLCLTNDHPKDNIIPIETFINQTFRSFVSSQLYKAIKNNRLQLSIGIIKNFKPKNVPFNFPKDLKLYEVWVQTYLPNEWVKGHEGQSHTFEFIKVDGLFKFYGLSSIP